MYIAGPQSISSFGWSDYLIWYHITKNFQDVLGLNLISDNLKSVTPIYSVFPCKSSLRYRSFYMAWMAHMRAWPVLKFLDTRCDPQFITQPFQRSGYLTLI